MTRLLGPDEGSRFIYRVVGTALLAAPNAPAVFYSDAAATLLADVRVYDGTATVGPAYAGSSVTADAYSSLPIFWFPDGVDTLWAVVTGGPARPVYARMDDRLDALVAAVVALDVGVDADLAVEAAARAAGDALLVPLATVGAASGVAPLDSESRVPQANLPPITITDTFVVASQAAMLALTAQRGDVAIRTDVPKTFILSTDSPATLADWVELPTPTDLVTSVAGRAGAVVLAEADVTGLVADLAATAKARWDATVRGEVKDDFADVARWGAGTGTPVISQVTNELGTPYAMRIVTASGVAGQLARDFVVNMTNKSLSFEFKTEDANFDQLRIDLTVDGRSSSRQFAKVKVVDNTTTATNVRNISQGIWKRVVIPASGLTSDTGSPTSVADVRLMRLTVTPKAGVSASVMVRNMRVHNDPMPAGILWVFDDARLNTYTDVRPLIEAKGWRGIIPTVTGKLGTDLIAGAPLMTLAQLQEMHAGGWEIVSHTVNHVTLAGLSLATVQAELRDSYLFLIANGFNAESAKFFVFPGGSWDEQARKEAIRHYRASRGVIDKAPQSAFICDPSLMQTLYCDNAKTAAQVITQIDAIVARGGVLVLSFHEVIPDASTPTSTSWPLSRFQQVIDYASSLNLPAYKYRDVYPFDLSETG